MWLVVALGGALLLTASGSGCATAVTEFSDEDETTTGSGGGQAGATSQGGGHQGGATSTTSTTELPCGIDCSTISTADCQEAVCNEQTKQCEVKNAADGTGCEDGQFCTVDDACVDGLCIGGPQNDCGVKPPACSQVTCNEAAKMCSTAPAQEGTPCTNPNDLCQVSTICQNGLCLGVPKDCFFAPVPDDCHVAQCNPMTGNCDPVPGNEGQTCVDSKDLCTVSKTCSNGVCQGGSPKDCSALTQGCNLGVCDKVTGQCTTQGVMQGQKCDDLDSCTSGETCNNGMCNGGTAISQCVNQDGCCPMGCTENNDDDCSCNQNLALTATGAHSGGGSGGYGPAAWNDGKKEQDCKNQGCTGCFGWVSNANTPGGKWVEYSWSSVQQVGSMYVDANPCSGGACNSGRTMVSGDIQYWDGSQWVTVQSFSNNDGDLKVTFNPKLNTTKIRIYNITAANCQQDSNTLIYEWFVYPGSNCSP